MINCAESSTDIVWSKNIIGDDNYCDKMIEKLMVTTNLH